MFRLVAPDVPVLVVAPWLSLRTRQILEAERINFIDLTGNALLRLDDPAVYISSSGATRNPEPTPRGRARVRGPKAARLIRILADVRPPYGVREIASAARLTPGYVSRLLETLDREALIERAHRGGVGAVDVPALLRWWAGSYDVFRSNRAMTFLAPDGAPRAAAQLATSEQRTQLAVTGSFAAGRIAPIAAPALLLVYCDDTAALSETLGLLPADVGGNVALLRPFDPVVWERVSEDGGLRYAAPSQVVVDCLTGTGRMPAEGEALLAWMAGNESSWRYASLTKLEATQPVARRNAA
ncbi:MAG: helix-turn-helix domain-containing protein [Solirubrobacteraceae bacterium]